MSGILSERRLAENQVVFRRYNEQAQAGLDDMARTAAEENVSTPVYDHEMSLYFYCECSNANCRERIRISLHLYNEIHVERDCFVVLPGHEINDIENVVMENNDFRVVKKIKAPPASNGRLNYAQGVL